jgi:CRP-like cAMP-binding protein
MTDVTHPAYQRLSKVAKRTLHAIEEQTATRPASITREQLQASCGVCAASATKARRELEAAGFISTSTGLRKAIVFQRSDLARSPR